MNRLSVIVVSFSAPGILEQCLLSLDQQTVQDGVEILVARRGTSDLQTRFAHRRWIAAPEKSTVPQLRSLGLTGSTGEIVVLLEDDCVAPPTWCATLLQAHEQPAVVIGGGVEPGNYRQAGDWAAYFCEFGRFMPPVPDGETEALPGTNVSYKRAALTVPTDGFYEAFVHRELQRAGQSLKSDNTLVVQHINTQPFSRVLASRYHHGRGYAAMRVTGRPWLQRLPYVAIALVLPVVMVSRILRVVFARARHVSRALRALPWIVALCVSWSLGEFLGYAAGPGKSLEDWH